MMSNMEDTKKLLELRQEIDELDFQILKLLNKRARTALKVRIAKGGTNIYRPEREAEVLLRSKKAASKLNGADRQMDHGNAR